MKPTYSNLTLTTGAFSSGICKIKIVPKEWLAEPIEKDFTTGKVIQVILLEEGKQWLTLELAENTYDFDEKLKSGRAGDYYETTIQGLINNISPELLQILQTFRYHEVIAIVMDRQRRWKVIGNSDAALLFRFSNKENNNQGGQQICSVDLSMETEHPSPFYEV
jgi:hypothetical protein